MGCLAVDRRGFRRRSASQAIDLQSDGGGNLGRLFTTVTLPKPQTSGAKSEGRFGKQDFAYLLEEDAYRCPAGERLPYRYTNEEDGKRQRRYWTTACQNCSLKSQCTTGPERRITRWEHEHLLEAVQQRLDSNPQAMRQRRETVEHPFGTMKARMGATHTSSPKRFQK